jgi:cytochrome c oxidase subunit II
MPPPVRRKTLVLTLALGAALALAAVAYGGNGGLNPQDPVSPDAERIQQTYNWIAIFAFAIFVVVEGALFWFIIRYRRKGRSRTAEGPQVHGATRLELIWTGIPVLILVAIAAFVFYKLPGIQDIPAAKAQGGPLQVRIDGHQFYWRFTYPDGTHSINDLHVPVDRVVQVNIHAQDVVHSWWVPQLQGKFDAIPGKVNKTWFQAERTGTFLGQCGEFCGVYHAKMKAQVVSQTDGDYKAFLATLRDPLVLGKQQWTGVCAQCHGMQGEGGYGPPISTSSILVNDRALRELLEKGQAGRNNISVYMPPVGRGWSDFEFKSLEAYLKKSIYKGPSSGG